MRVTHGKGGVESSWCNWISRYEKTICHRAASSLRPGVVAVTPIEVDAVSRQDVKDTQSVIQIRASHWPSWPLGLKACRNSSFTIP